jgi:hypothetical protein
LGVGIGLISKFDLLKIQTNASIDPAFGMIAQPDDATYIAVIGPDRKIILNCTASSDTKVIII